MDDFSLSKDEYIIIFSSKFENNLIYVYATTKKLDSSKKWYYKFNDGNIVTLYPYVEISNNQKSFLVSSNENGKSSNFRLGTNDEGPILIVKIRPSYFLRLQYNSISEYYSGHLYSLDPSNKFYKLIGEIIKLK